MYDDARVLVKFGHEQVTNRFRSLDQVIKFPDQIVRHPMYEKGLNEAMAKNETVLTEKEQLYQLYDIAVIQLNNPIDKSMPMSVNSICLPDPTVQTNRGQYVAVGGWSESYNGIDFLEIGYRQTMDHKDIPGQTDYFDLYVQLELLTYPVENQSFLCEVIHI